MGQTVHYPMNFFSRAVTNVSGTYDTYLYFLCHADRATVASGTWYVDQTSWDRSVLTRGSSIIQTDPASYFGDGGITFTGLTAIGDAARIVWGTFDLTYSAGSARQAIVLDSFIYLTSLDTVGMYWFDVCGFGDSSSDYIRAYFNQRTSGQWQLTVNAFRPAQGMFFSHDYLMSGLTTGSWMHLAFVRGDSALSFRVGIFHNGSQLPLLSGGFPTGGALEGYGWSDSNFSFSTGSAIAWGGLVNTAGPGANPYRVISGSMDELRVSLGNLSEVTYDPLFDIYYFAVPTAPYSPADGTFNITAKILSLGSATLSPTTNGGLSLGSSGSTWLDVWSSGTAYLNRVGQNFTMVGTTRINFGTASVYMFSSSSGYLTLVAGTQIDLQSNVGMSAVNFIFDTATGVKVGTATGQRFAFWGATPITRPAATHDLKDVIAGVGFIADGSATPLNLDGGRLTAGSGSFTASVSVNGAFYATGYHFNVTQIGSGTTSYSLTTANDVLVCNVGVNASVILPNPTQSGKIFFVKNVASAGTVTLSCGTNTAALIDLATTLTLTSQQVARLLDGRSEPGGGSADFSAWSYRRLLTVSTSTAVAVGTVSNFPMMVRFTTANFTFANARSDGLDIRFALTDDSSLNHYRIFHGYTLDTTTNIVTGSTVTGDTTGGNWANLSSTTDNNDTSFANSFDGAGPHWLRYQLGTARVVNYLRVRPYLNANGRTMRDFILEGSNDTSGAWTALYTGIHRDNAHYESYVVQNTVAYSFYRLYFSNSWQTSGLIGIYEVQMYSNASTQMGVYMVNVPTLAAGSQLYVYYGNATAVDVSTSGAWNSDFAAVWPMHTMGSASNKQVVDVTSYGRHATATVGTFGAPNLIWNSLQGYVMAYYGSQILTVADDSVWDDGMVNWTWIMFVVESATGGNKAYVGRSSSGSTYLYWGKDNGSPLRWRDFSGGPDINTLSPSVVTNSVTMLTMKRSSNQFELFRNDVSIGTASNAATLISRTDALTIGAASTINYYVNGTMWNLQIITVAQGTNWIRTKYYSDTDQLIATVSAEETFTSGGGGPVYHWITV